nr:hypothetical protein [Akkermansiaceae bacterium]
MKSGTVRIHFLYPSDALQDGSDCLSAEELQRAAAFKFPHDAQRWKSFRKGIRTVLGGLLEIPPSEVPIRIDPHGKPQLAAPFDSLHFNLSHCEDLALLAVCGDGPVGIDVEAIHRA